MTPVAEPPTEPRPRGPRAGVSSLDTIGQIQVSFQDLLNIAYYQAVVETRIEKDATSGVLAAAGVWLWDVLKGVSTATATLFQITGTALSGLWSLAIHPPLVWIHNGLVALWDLVRLPILTTTQGLGWLLGILKLQLVAWLSGLGFATQGIASALRLAGPVTTSPVLALEQLLFAAGLTTRDAFAELVAKHNTLTDWLNLLLTPQGVSREAQWMYTAWGYAGDLLYVLISYLIGPDLEERKAADALRWRTAAAPAFVVDFIASNVRTRAELDAAIAGFRAAGGP